jgi:hypothetical protein
MDFYRYDDNGHYTGTVKGQKNPIRVWEYLQPINTTDIAPPSEYTIEQIPKFNKISGEWELVKSQYKKDLEASQLEEVNEYGVLLNEMIDDEVVPRDPQIIQSETDIIIQQEATEQLEAEIQAIKNTMDQNIITEAMAVTGASSTESAQAFIQAYQLRMANPAEYVNEGLKVYYPIDTYILGEDLDTEAKITDYYKKVTIYLDKFREAEIASYLSQKAVIEAS